LVFLSSYCMKPWDMLLPSNSKLGSYTEGSWQKVSSNYLWLIVLDCSRDSRTVYSRGLIKYIAKRYYCNWKRWTSVTARPSLHSRQHDSLFHCSRHASKRAHVSKFASCQLKLGFNHFFRRFKRVGPNAMRGRGIGTARGRATIMRGEIILILTVYVHLLTLSYQQTVCIWISPLPWTLTLLI
jgi:hypothetical protein